MASDGVNLVTFSVMALLFIAATLALGWYGYKNTKKDNQAYLLGRNKTNAAIIALSYGATFLSASRNSVLPMSVSPNASARFSESAEEPALPSM